jgi:hypothetical protein
MERITIVADASDETNSLCNPSKHTIQYLAENGIDLFVDFRENIIKIIENLERIDVLIIDSQSIMYYYRTPSTLDVFKKNHPETKIALLDTQKPTPENNHYDAFFKTEYTLRMTNPSAVIGEILKMLELITKEDATKLGDNQPKYW